MVEGTKDHKGTKKVSQLQDRVFQFQEYVPER